MQDLRLALRQLRRAPGFTLAAVLTLAIGIGANTGIYSVLNGQLKPLPVPNPEQLVVIASELPSNDSGFRFHFSFSALQDYRAATRDVFSDVFAFDTRVAGINARGTTSQFVYHAISGNLFAGMGVTPAAGRLFAPGEGEQTGSERVAVLGYRHWMRRFGGDPSIIGSMVKIDGEPTRVVGVTQEGFHGIIQHAEVDGYIPFATMRRNREDAERFFTSRAVRGLVMMARMKPGVTVEDAQAAVDVVARSLGAQYPADEANLTARVMLETDARPVPSKFLTGVVPKVMAALLGLATLVLVIACLNVANLMLVRSAARQREMAVRASLGAGRVRLATMLITESLLVSVLGLVVGLVFAKWATALFIGAINPRVDVPLNLQFDYDWTVFAYAAAVALVTGIVLGVAPARRAARVQGNAALHDGGYGGSSGIRRQRARSVLVIAQVAGSLVLLIVAGLCVRNLRQMQWFDLGFEPDRLASVRIDPRQAGYSQERTNQFYDELERRLRALPEVESVGTSVSMPLGYIFFGCVATPEGSDAMSRPGPRDAYLCNPVSPSYFETLRLPIVEGRAFSTHDTPASTPVVIVNETLAARLWPGEQAIGKRLVMPGQKTTVRTVVGVARDSKYLAAFEGQMPYLYWPMTQDPSSLRSVHVRVTGSPSAFLPALAREVHALDPEVPLADVLTMREALDGSMGVLMFRLGAMQAATMGGLGLLLAMIGVYGVVSYSATQRTREIGIRLALGAPPRAIGRLVIGQGAGLVAGGIIAGLAAAALVSRALSRFFYFVGATDAPTFAGVTLLLAIIALVACYLPARRAMRVNPIVALRHE